jgi:hypothetical protein
MGDCDWLGEPLPLGEGEALLLGEVEVPLTNMRIRSNTRSIRTR